MQRVALRGIRPVIDRSRLDVSPIIRSMACRPNTVARLNHQLRLLSSSSSTMACTSSFQLFLLV